MSETVTVRDAGGGVYEVTMCDAERANGLEDKLCRELQGALSALAVKPTAKVVILAGTREVFCSGATLHMLEQYGSGERSVRDMPLQVAQVLSFPLPLIAAVEGHAVGGGLVLAACCDVLVAAQESRYGLNFTEMGFTPGMGSTALIPALTGHGLASEMMFSGKLYKGRELAGKGLFNHVVPAAEVRGLALELAQRFAEKPRHVLVMLKEALSLHRRQAVALASFQEHLMHSICFSQPDFTERLRELYRR